MNHDTTSPAPKTFCVWADCNRRVYQEVEARSPEEAHRLARENPEGWLLCAENEADDYALSDDVQNLDTREFTTINAQREDMPPNCPWTAERWAAARADSRWAAERWAAGMRERFGRYPSLHAEDKIWLAMDVLWDVVETWDHDTLLYYPEELPSFDEYLAEIGSNVYAIRWSRPDSSPAAAHGNAA